MKIIQFFLFAFLLIIFASASFWTTRSTITANKWTSIETWSDFDGDGTFLMDTSACSQDNDWQFFETGGLMITEDLLKCEPEKPYLDTIITAWSLTDNDTKIMIRIGEDEDFMPMRIHTIGPNELVLHFSGNGDNGDAAVRQRIILRR